MSKITWTVSEPGDGGYQSTGPKRKAKYAAKQRMKDDMSESQKNGIIQWNDMIDVLRENGLLEEKE
jgi:hypothetical protein